MNKEANIQHPTFNVQHRTPINSVFASTRHGRCCERALNSEPRVATATNDGGANLPVCPNLTDSKFSDAGGTWGYARTSLCSFLWKFGRRVRLRFTSARQGSAALPWWRWGYVDHFINSRCQFINSGACRSQSRARSPSVARLAMSVGSMPSLCACASRRFSNSR